MHHSFFSQSSIVGYFSCFHVLATVNNAVMNTSVQMSFLIWVLKKLRIDLPYDPAIPLLGIYPKDLKNHTLKDICTPMFIAALFTVARKYKQAKCPTIDDWIKKL